MDETATPGTVRTLATWRRLYGDLMDGLAHDLAGRASALHSLALVGRRGPPSETFVLDELEAETEKLAKIGEAVRGLAEAADATDGEMGVVDLGTLCPQAIGILRLHHEFVGDELQTDVPASAPTVLAPAAELTRVLLLLAAEVASRGAGRVRVRAPNGRPGTVVSIQLLTSAAHPSTTDAGEVVLTDGDAEHLTHVIETWGGGLERTGLGWEVELPNDASL